MQSFLFLGMYPWEYSELSDTVRSMAKAFPKVFSETPVYLNPFAIDRNPRFSLSCKEEQGVEIWTPAWAFLPTRYGFYKLRDQLAVRSVARALKRRPSETKVTLYVTSSTLELAYLYMEAIKPNYLLFDVVDDNLDFPMDPAKREHLTWIFRQIASRADVIAAVSEQLVNKTEQITGCQAHYLPNGVDFANFSKQPVRQIERSPLFPSRICFVGAFTSWIDLELLADVADQVPEAELLLIGPKLDVDEEKFTALVQRQNVSWLGAKAFEEVPAYLHSSDVLVLPRIHEEYSQACDPLKLYEYLATGKPVVSTFLPSAERFADVARIAGNRHQFVEYVKESLVHAAFHNPQPQLQRVKSRSWEKRIGEFGELLAKISHVEEKQSR